MLSEERCFPGYEIDTEEFQRVPSEMLEPQITGINMNSTVKTFLWPQQILLGHEALLHESHMGPWSVQVGAWPDLASEPFLVNSHRDTPTPTKWARNTVVPMLLSQD